MLRTSMHAQATPAIIVLSISILPYSGKFSRGAKFRVFRGQGGNHENLNSGVNVTSLLEMHMRGGGQEINGQQCSRWIEIAMAVYRYFQPVDSLSDTKGPLSTHPPR